MTIYHSYMNIMKGGGGGEAAKNSYLTILNMYIVPVIVAYYMYGLQHGRPQRGRGRVRVDTRPPPGIKNSAIWGGGGLFATFSLCVSFLLCFHLIVGLFDYEGTFSNFFLHVGDIFCPYWGDFWPCPPFNISADAHGSQAFRSVSLHSYECYTSGAHNLHF